MSGHAEKPDVAVRVYGRDAMTGAVKAGAAMLNLLDALTEEAAPDADLHWRVVAMGWCCDGCDLQVGVEKPDDWVLIGAEDFCPACASERRANGLEDVSATPSGADAA
jgi:hypothetical protein